MTIDARFVILWDFEFFENFFIVWPLQNFEKKFRLIESINLLNNN